MCGRSSGVLQFIVSLFLTTVWLAPVALAGEPLLVKYIGNNTSINEDYYLALISAALKVTESTHGPFKLMYAQEQISSERKHDLLVLGDKVNVDRLVGFPTMNGARKGLIRVGVPILNGFMGYRILLIRNENQPLFSNIKSSDELRKLPMGFGKGWEGHVYKHNGFSVAEALTMPMLLKMLAGKRYYFVPLSAIEIDDHYEIDGALVRSLVPEKSLLIYMPLPVYFYVSPAAPELADRLTLGLNYLSASGLMGKIFTDHFGERLKRLHLADRQLIELSNPDDDGSLGVPDHRRLQLF
ncbi:hypothetical protein [Cellvibrio mixtus]|uniref:hypothetical protein n=1 Tax=Cellvibrio mixtus TaxID=39650 RepID=UPI0005877636|nr:hypothetical protein [Cellvibrio mixtus]